MCNFALHSIQRVLSFVLFKNSSISYLCFAFSIKEDKPELSVKEQIALGSRMLREEMHKLTSTQGKTFSPDFGLMSNAYNGPTEEWGHLLQVVANESGKFNINSFIIKLLVQMIHWFIKISSR